MSVSIQDDDYIIFLATSKQIEDIKNFIAAVKVFYRSIQHSTFATFGNHPIFLGPTFFHFRKDEATFCRFFSEIISLDREILNLGKIGTDLDNAIFNGFSILAKKLEKLICVFHLKRADKKKLSELSKKSVVGRNVTKSIINDIHGTKYGTKTNLTPNFPQLPRNGKQFAQDFMNGL